MKHYSFGVKGPLTPISIKANKPVDDPAMGFYFAYIPIGPHLNHLGRRNNNNHVKLTGLVNLAGRIYDRGGFPTAHLMREHHNWLINKLLH
jgi:hypothetical protein